LKINVISPHFSSVDRYNWIKRNQQATPLEFWRELKDYSEQLDILFFSTPMSRGAAEILSKIDVPVWKIGSGDILDFVMLDYVAQTGKPVIISTGMSSLEEIDKAVNFLRERTDKIIIMHCVSKYPCPPEELNLKTIRFLEQRYNLPVGFSSHSINDKDAVAAAIDLGAKVIEKHFSLSRDLWGPDHKVSLTPDEFKSMVNMAYSGKKSNFTDLGSEYKILNNDEMVFRPIFRKSLVAGKNIKAGETISKEKIYSMRPHGYINGLPSEEYENVIGKKALKNLNKYDPITISIIE